MADPTGSIGAVQQSDLALAAKGGPKFMDRLKRLADATDRHDEAFAKLQIGQDAVAALDDAKGKVAAAEAMRSQAAKTLADARSEALAQIAKASQIVADANAQQTEATKRLKQVEAREQAAAEAIAKAERAKADAERLSRDLQRRIDYLRTQVQEIAA